LLLLDYSVVVLSCSARVKANKHTYTHDKYESTYVTVITDNYCP
jgi:hypothetical protein